MSRLITNSNFKLEITRRFNLHSLVVQIGGILGKNFKAALKHSFIVYSRILNRRFIITLLIYSTGSIIVTNLPLLVDSKFSNIDAQLEINNQLFKKLHEICLLAVPSDVRRNVNVHGSKIHETLALLPNYGCCSFNNISISFKSLELARAFETKSFSACIKEMELALPEFNISGVDNRDYFTASKIFVVGTAEDSVKINFTFFKQFGQVICSGVKSYSDCFILKRVIGALLS